MSRSREARLSAYLPRVGLEPGAVRTRLPIAESAARVNSATLSGAMAGPFDTTAKYLVHTYPRDWLHLLGHEAAGEVRVVE
ncbi:MAG: hypothetical protein ACKVVP_02060, partial [Chloroflexota bacterium]